MKYTLLLLILVACKSNTVPFTQASRSFLVFDTLRPSPSLFPNPYDMSGMRCGVIHYRGDSAYECDFKGNYFALYRIKRIPVKVIVNDKEAIMQWAVRDDSFVVNHAPLKLKFTSGSLGDESETGPMGTGPNVHLLKSTARDSLTPPKPKHGNKETR
jgi:hypothetical protein